MPDPRLILDMARAGPRLLHRIVAPLLPVVPHLPPPSTDDTEPWWVGEPRWYPGAPPRRGNRIDVLVDGRAAMLDMYRAITLSSGINCPG